MDIRTVLVRWVEEPDGMPFETDVVVGDGSVIYDDKYPEYDERIFFYFQDAEEYKVAFSGGSPRDGIEFEILEEV
jgi:hypothetical protein